jgi:hypothetical protein
MKDIATSIAMSSARESARLSTIFRDITPCSPLSVNRRFGGIYRLHLQGKI